MQTSTDRESFEAAERELDGIAAGHLDGAADEVLAVAGLLHREPRLRRALADSARTADERAGLLRGLLDGKVGTDAVNLVAVLVGGRWSAPSQLLDAVERLGVTTLLAAADGADELAEVEDELFRFGQVVDGAPQLAAVLGDPTVPVAQRATLVDDLLGGKARPVTVRLAEVALAGFGGRGFAASLARLVELAAARREREVAYVTSAAPLAEEEERRLGDRLRQLYGRPVSVLVTVDPRILGGLSVRIGSDLYDGTVLRRLNDARGALTK